MSRASPNTVLITAFNNRVFGLDVGSGQIRWEVALTGFGGEVDIAIEGGIVIASNNDHLSFLDYETGHVYAAVRLPGEHASRPTMLVADGRVHVARGGEVSCFDMRGEPMWLQPFKGKGVGSVALAVPGAVRQADDVGGR